MRCSLKRSPTGTRRCSSRRYPLNPCPHLSRGQRRASDRSRQRRYARDRQFPRCRVGRPGQARIGSRISRPEELGLDLTLPRNIRALDVPANPNDIVDAAGRTRLEVWLEAHARAVEGAGETPIDLPLVDLTADRPAPQPAGTAITFTATATGAGAAPVQVVGLRRCVVDDRAGLERPQHVHLAASAGESRLHRCGVGAQRIDDHRHLGRGHGDAVSDYGVGAAPGRADGKPHGPAGHWDGDHLHGGGNCRRGTLSVQVLGVRRCDLDGRAGLEHRQHVHLAAGGGECGLRGCRVGAQCDDDHRHRGSERAAAVRDYGVDNAAGQADGQPCSPPARRDGNHLHSSG